MSIVESSSIIEQSARRAVGLRHQLHEIPELGYEEFKTAAAIRAELDALGLAYVAGVPDAPTATVAWIGDTSKPCVARRAFSLSPVLRGTPGRG